MNKYSMISWNVNGIKSTIDKGLIEFVKKEDPDFLCMQEVKTHYIELDRLLPNYKAYWNPAERKGYSGTLIYSKIKALKSKKGMGIPEHDTEGRVTSLELEKFYLVTVYTVNAKRGLARLDYRMKWDKDFLDFITKLDKKKPVIVCGDLNVAHKEIDLAHPKRNKKNAGFTQQERDGFSAYIETGFVDTFRHFDQSPEKYTWWSNFSNARERNVGWRLDYFVASKRLMGSIKKSEIMSEIHGSDHCPIKLELEI